MTQEKHRPSPRQEFDGGAYVGPVSPSSSALPTTFVVPVVPVAPVANTSNYSGKLLYTIPEAARLLSLSRAHVYRLLERGDLVSVRSGRSRRISWATLETYVIRLEHEAGSERAPPMSILLPGRDGLAH